MLEFEKGYTYYFRKQLFLRAQEAVDRENPDWWVNRIDGKEVKFIPGTMIGTIDEFHIFCAWCEDDVKFENGTLYNKLSKVENKVNFLLEHFPETRDDNYELMNKYAQYELGIDYPRELYDLHTPSVMRSRRKLQNTLHLFEAKEFVEDSRKETQAVFQEFYGKEK